MVNNRVNFHIVFIYYVDILAETNATDTHKNAIDIAIRVKAFINGSDHN